MIRVLLVDDNESVREGYASGLRHLGCDVAEASNVADALERVDGCDVAVVDLRLGEEDGEALMVLLRKQATTRLPVILMTGGIYRGATVPDLLVDKPLTSHQLMAAIRKVLS
jgi:CheY-like chemotaxis protein